MNELALFAGAGGGILGGKLLGWRTVCAVEIAPYTRSVLLARQADGCLEPFPVWDDITTFDGTAWRGRVDVVSGGFPCQDISSAGKGAGIDGERSGLWAEMARIIGEVRPRYVLVENSPMLVVRGLGRVLGDLATLGYDARWGVLGGVNAGIPTRRNRLWVAANTKCPVGILDQNAINAWSNTSRVDALGGSGTDVDVQNKRASALPVLEHAYWAEVFNGGGSRGIDGLADRVVREKAIGNGQVPAVVRLAWETLMGTATAAEA